MSNHHLDQQANTVDSNDPNTPSLIPKSVTIGLASFALVLSLAGYVFRLLAGDPLADVIRHAAVLVPLFVVVIPAGFWLGSVIMNKVKGMHIQRRNALTLGWLISCVTMLWFMGAYS
ncbi:hypothetical protein [Psychrobacter sp. FDAARGOS_221]|uniref:hypothetical protein n=1 Tax=Psychrobacter sp. FDAARGOS_221 TaxID=1975705 RepID=UPI000BB56746|nr:hypothetical protein [Psychrobacter sp. FDAARGOS_221]PNK60174.1 hypothetical protein A6J60_004340 [Psychrobacter sp. FDAARGOS_221]